MTKQLLTLLHLMHSFELSHGCLTPENVHVAEYGRCAVAVAGFGADSDGSGHAVPQTGTVPGTHPFRAPELLLGLESTAKTDLWCVARSALLSLLCAPPPPTPPCHTILAPSICLCSPRVHGRRPTSSLNLCSLHLSFF